MEWFEWAMILSGALTMVGAVWLEIRHRYGIDERVAVLESQMNGLPETVVGHGERLAGLEAVKSSPYREPTEDPHRCDKCGRFKGKREQ